MTKRWDRSAMRFVSAKYVSRHNLLEVTFENGDHFLVATKSLLPPPSNGQARPRGSRSTMAAASWTSPDWGKVRISKTGDVLEVPGLDTVIEIPWHRIRTLADSEFRAHWAGHARQRARKLGARMRTLRLEAGRTRAALAGKIGLTRAKLADLEAGQSDPSPRHDRDHRRLRQTPPRFGRGISRAEMDRSSTSAAATPCANATSACWIGLRTAGRGEGSGGMEGGTDAKAR